MNCEICSSNKCQQCEDGYYLHNDKCVETCPLTFYADNGTQACESCIENCVVCTSDSDCTQCIDDYSYDDASGECLDEAFIEFGVLANMSGFTSNITEVTATVYVGTSVGPMVFG